jgi:hypothetical protein
VDRSRSARQAWRPCQLLLLLLFAPTARAQDIAVELFTGGQEWVRRDGVVELVLSRWPSPEEGQVAVVVGGMDRTDLFRRTARGLAYRPELMPLPSGEHEVAVYLVARSGEWRLLAQLPLRVLRPGGLEAASFAARLELGSRLRVGESHSPAENPPPRDHVRDGTFQLSLQGAARRTGWTLEPAMNVVGSSFRGEALRFATEGESAPRADLASYGVRLARGGGALQVGHLTHGEHRLLLLGFASRGLALALPLGERATVSLAAVNGSQIVGWDNLLGIAESRHRVLTGTLGFEVLPRAGALRVEGSYLNGKLLPLAGFNQGVVDDAESARGWGLRLLAATPSQRFRLEGGFARSRFDNPADLALSQGLEVVRVERETRDARYLDASLGLLQRPLAKLGSATVRLDLRHSHVEPLYRTVGAFVQSDRDENAADLAVQVGPAALLTGFSAGEDNLDHIPTIHTTRTRRRTANLAAPLGQLWPTAKGPRNGLPLVSYTFDRVHQYGLGVAPGSGMRPDQIPDQVSRSQSAGLDWQAGGLRFGARLGESDQDNRQPGRERADFVTRTAGISAGGSPWRALDLGAELTRERTDNVEQRSTQATLRYGLDFTWRALPRLTCTGVLSTSRATDEQGPSRSRDWGTDLQVVWALPERRAGGRQVTGQLFVRWLDRRADSRNQLFDLVTDTALSTVDAGLSINVF